MGNNISVVNPGFINFTGHAFIIPAKKYRDAAHQMSKSGDDSGFDPVPYFMYCQSLELYLKAFLWANEAVPAKKLKFKYGHNLNKLWTLAKQKGIHRFAKPTELRDKIICLMSTYYVKRQLIYYDLDLIFQGFNEIRTESRTLDTLDRLTSQLDKSLQKIVSDGSRQIKVP